MTIQEAIKSGRRFKLPGWHVWYRKDLPDVNKFSNADLLRDDWEVEEEKVEITRSQFVRELRYEFDKAGGLLLSRIPHLLNRLGFSDLND